MSVAPAVPMETADTQAATTPATQMLLDAEWASGYIYIPVDRKCQKSTQKSNRAQKSTQKSNEAQKSNQISPFTQKSTQKSN